MRDSKAPFVHNVEYWQCLLVARDNEALVVCERKQWLHFLYIDPQHILRQLRMADK